MKKYSEFYLLWLDNMRDKAWFDLYCGVAYEQAPVASVVRYTMLEI